MEGSVQLEQPVRFHCSALHLFHYGSRDKACMLRLYSPVKRYNILFYLSYIDDTRTAEIHCVFPT